MVFNLFLTYFKVPRRPLFPIDQLDLDYKFMRNSIEVDGFFRTYSNNEAACSQALERLVKHAEKMLSDEFSPKK